MLTALALLLSVATTMQPAATTPEVTQSLVTTHTVDPTFVRSAYTATTHEELAADGTQLMNRQLSAVLWPIAGEAPVSDPFGPREAPCDGCSTFHKGLDLAPAAGTPVQAIASGTVREAVDSDGGLGVHVIIDHMVDGVLVSSLYAHLQHGSLKLSPGDTVLAGEHVGQVGSTGQSTGPHLHFEILMHGTEPIDPVTWLLPRITV